MVQRTSPTDHAISAAELAACIRRDVIEQSKRAGVGHIGSSLSIADLVAAVFTGPFRFRPEDDPDRDRFVLSKGHAVLALYSALHQTGCLSREQLESFGTDGTELAGHPEHTLTGIDFSTGSLGQGLSMATGCALAGQLQSSDRRTVALLSDAECDEGSVWEAAMFAAHHRLDRLLAIIDVNGQQALGYTEDVLSLEPLRDRWRSFGWDVVEVDGHDHDALAEAIAAPASGGPRVLLASTVFGKGISYMERRIEWHYLPMSDEHYEQAIGELDSEPS
jgi:transketolase